LLDPQRVDEVRKPQSAQFAVLVDTSRSMGVQDVPGGRLASATSWIHQQLIPAWPAGVARSVYGFSGALESLATLDAASPTGGVTALAGALQHLLAAPSEQTLAGVILCSDGNDSADGDVPAIAKEFRRKGIPIHTTSFGTTREPHDIAIENVQVKRAVP